MRFIKKLVFEGILLGLVAGLFVFALATAACTAQESARNWGGTASIELPAGKKLVLATWKDDEIWYLLRPMRQSEEPETYEFAESSSYGMVEGKIIFREQR